MKRGKPLSLHDHITDHVRDVDLRLVLDTIPGFVATSTPTGEMEFANRQLLQYLGKTLDEATGWGTMEVIHPDDLERIGKSIASWSDVSDAPIGVHLDIRLRGADGGYRWFEMRAVQERDARGAVGRWYYLLTDIEDRRRAEQTARGAERDLRLAIDAIPALVNLFTPTGELEFSNRRVLEYCGRTIEELRAWETTNLIHPDDLPTVRARWNRSLRTGDSFDLRHRLRGADGTYHWFHGLIQARRTAEGDIARWYGVMTAMEDLKEAEETARNAEFNSRLAIDHLPGLVCTATATGETEFVNRQLLDYFGRTLEEIKSWRTSDEVHPDDLPQVAATFDNRMQSPNGPGPFELDLRLRRADGVYRWFHLRGQPARDAAGHVVRWHHLLIDIEDRRQTEERLRRSEAFLLEAQRLSHAGNWGHTLSTGRVTTSPELVRVFDVQPGEDTSDPAFWFGRMHPEDRARATATFERCERERIEYQDEYRIVLPDGSIRYLRAVGHPVLNGRGELVEFVGMAMDTTDQSLVIIERERANRALRESERELSLIIETMPGLVWCASPDGELTYVNQRILEYLGAPVEHLRQGGWANFLHPDDRAVAIDAWARAVASAETYEMQSRLRRSDGAYRWVQVMSQLGRDREGRPTRWYGLLLDIDDRKNVEDALRRTERRLAQAAHVATVGELAAAVAHEVNQPLAAVVTNGQACLSWLSTVPVNLVMARQAVERIVRDAKDAGEVVRRIRALFKGAALETTVLDLNEVVREVVHLLRKEITSRHVAVICELGDGVARVPADRVQLQHLLFNLLVNGLEALEPVIDRPREIRLSTRRDGDRAIIDLRDNGAGLEDPHRIFDAFFTTKPAGMGMGLAICRSIVHAHGGEITAAPQQVGTIFTFTLPIP